MTIAIGGADLPLSALMHATRAGHGIPLLTSEASLAAGDEFLIYDASASLPKRITTTNLAAGHGHTAAQITAGTFTAGTYSFAGSTISACDQFNCDNLRLDGNTLSSQNTNGDITLDPDGTGSVLVASGANLHLSSGKIGAGVSPSGAGTIQAQEGGLNPAANINASFVSRGSFGGGYFLADGSGVCGLWASSSGAVLNISAGGTASGFPTSAGQLQLTGGNLSVLASTASTSPTTGALVVTGGVGIGNNLIAAGSVEAGAAETNGKIIARAVNSSSPQFVLGNAAGVNHWAMYQALAVAAQGTFIISDVASGYTDRLYITPSGNIILGNQSALATNATAGFAYVPTCAGTPTGTPTAYAGKVPLIIDTTNHKLYFYSGGAWRDAGP